MDKEYQMRRLADLEDDMNDDLKSWQEAEKEVLAAIEWKSKKALDYANSAVKYYNLKKEIENNESQNN